MSEASFSAKDVQTLRQQTGAGMMDAKRALTETGGNMENAARWLREKGLAQSAKRSDRDADQGAVSVANTGSVAAAVELRCETDFVAKSPDFVALVEDLADAVATKGENAVAERQGDVETLGITLKENISVGRVVRFEAPAGAVLDAYLHIQNERGVNGVLVELLGGDQALAHEIALHIAFARPEYLTRDEVPAEEVQKEREILEAETRNEGKPEQAIEKIVEGKLAGRFFAERVLMEQKFVRDPKMTIKQLLGDAKVTRFAQLEVGRQKGLRSSRLTARGADAGRASCSSCRAKRSLTPRSVTGSMARSWHGWQPRSPRRNNNSAPRSPSSSAAATSGGDRPVPARAWTAPTPTTWACLPR